MFQHERVQTYEARAREQMLGGNAPNLRFDELPQRDLLGVERREAGMAAFACDDAGPASIRKQVRNAEPGTGTDDHARPRRGELDRLNRRAQRSVGIIEADRGGFEVVAQDQPWNRESRRQAIGIDAP